MGRLIGAHPELPYSERTRRLIEHGISVWDICAVACRPGSLDSAIYESSVTPNNFEAFLVEHPGIDLISFNGSKAADLYRKAVLPTLSSRSQSIRRELLPSEADYDALFAAMKDDMPRMWREVFPTIGAVRRDRNPDHHADRYRYHREQRQAAEDRRVSGGEEAEAALATDVVASRF